MTGGLTGTTGTARGTDPAAKPAECEGSACRHSAAAGRAREFAVAGTPLCPDCRLRLTHDLRRLPRLYDECGLLLGGTNRPRDRTSGGGRPPGLPFNTAAADARSAIAGILRSWAALVVQERGVSAPPDTVVRIAGFLLRHSDWLAAHRAAGELSYEVAKAVRRARNVIEPTPARRVPVGGCVEADCQGDLTAAVRPRGAVPVEISCDAVPSHRWSAHEWLKLGHRSAPGRRKPSGTAGTPQAVGTPGPADPPDPGGTPGPAATADPPDQAGTAGAAGTPGAADQADPAGTPGVAATEPPAPWLSARDIALLWGIAPGSVYRRASEHRWRRRTRNGRTHYHAQDVRQSLDANT